MSHYMPITLKIPRNVERWEAIGPMEVFIYKHLDEFQCLPREDQIKEHIKYLFAGEPRKELMMMVKLTDEEAVNSACDRSEYKHKDVETLSKKKKRNLRKISKRKRSRSSSGDEPVHKKSKECRCPICLDDLDAKKTVTLDCDCVFHYKCIKQWLSIKEVCPTCEKVIKI